MVINSDVRLNPGDIYEIPYMRDYQGNKLFDVRAYILREATREEWEKGIREQGYKPDDPNYPWFYEVSMD